MKMIVIFFNLQVLPPLYAYIRFKFLRNYADAGKELSEPCNSIGLILCHSHMYSLATQNFREASSNRCTGDRQRNDQSDRQVT